MRDDMTLDQAEARIDKLTETLARKLGNQDYDNLMAYRCGYMSSMLKIIYMSVPEARHLIDLHIEEVPNVQD